MQVHIEEGAFSQAKQTWNEFYIAKDQLRITRKCLFLSQVVSLASHRFRNTDRVVII